MQRARLTHPCRQAASLRMTAEPDHDPSREPIAAHEPARRSGSIVLVLLVAGGIVAAAVALMTIGRAQAQPYILGLLALLAMVGLFNLFAFAAGIIRFADRAADDPVMGRIADHAYDGLAVTDPRGHVVYSNAAYLALTGAATAQDVRPVERVFIGNPDVSEAVFRLLKAAREGKRQQEEVRIAGHDGSHGRWLRMRVRPLGQGKREAKYAVWSIADITRDRERQEDVFQELQHAIEYLDHAPCGFFSVNPAGDLVYVNATLANWLDHDLAEIGSGGLKLTDIVSGDGASLLTSIVAVPGEVKTEVFDIDLRMRGGKTMPVRLYHKLAFGADGVPGASRTLVISRARDERSDPQRAAEVRFMRFFDHTPMAIATVDRAGAVVRANARFAKLAQSLEPRRRRQQVDLPDRQRPRPQPADRGDQPGGGRAGRYPAGRGDARRRQGALGAVLRHRGRGRRARDRGRHRLHAGDHRAAHAGEPDQPVAEDGHGRPARRRHRARLQQRALRHHDGERLPAERAQADRSVVPGHHADQAERDPRRDAGAAAAGVLAQARPCGRRCSISATRCPISPCCCAG